MKQISSAFRRRKPTNSTAAAGNAEPKQPTQQVTVPSPGRINTTRREQPSIKVIHFAATGKSATAATAASESSSAIDSSSRPTIVIAVEEEPKATIINRANPSLVPRSSDRTTITSSSTISDTVDLNSYGYGTPTTTDQYLSPREQLWYKNQMYLLAKQQQQHQQHQQQNVVSRGLSSPMEESKTMDRSPKVRYNLGGGDRQRYSPKGVDELFEPDDGGSGVVRKKVLTNQNSRRRDYDDDDDTDIDDDDTRTNLSRRLREDEDSSTTQRTTSVLDDDTRTYLSSLLFEDDDDVTQHSDTSELFDGVGLDSSAVSGYSTTAETESESLFASLEEDGTTTSMSSYVFQLVDDSGGGGKHQRRKYQLGVGQNPNLIRKPRLSSKSRRTDNTISTTNTITAWPQRAGSRREKNSTVDANFGEEDDGAECPLIQVFLDEVTGTYKDAKLAFDQVLHAFCISPDNVDQMTDVLSDAKMELLDMCYKRGPRRDQPYNNSY